VIDVYFEQQNHHSRPQTPGEHHRRRVTIHQPHTYEAAAPRQALRLFGVDQTDLSALNPVLLKQSKSDRK
jgi:hypothetical protein